jgi:hypothetical protein
MGIRGPFLPGERHLDEVLSPQLCSTKVKNAWSQNSSIPRFSYKTKDRDRFTVDAWDSGL